MDVVIITGASSALGQTISRKLLGLGFRVYGVGGDYSKSDLNNIDFFPIPCDLSDAKAVDKIAREILGKEKSIYAIIHNAKFYPRDRYLETHGEILERSLRINLLCPLILTQVLAETLCRFQGHVIQIGPAQSELSRGGVIGATAAAGLRSMGEAIFEELRDHGVRVCYLSPEPNGRRSTSSRQGPDPFKETTIDSNVIAEAIAQLLGNQSGNLITEMVIRPLRAEPRGVDPVLTLPYPPPQPIPYTVPREIIEAEELLEEEKFKKAEEKKHQRQKKQKPSKKSKPSEVEADKGEKFKDEVNESQGKSERLASSKEKEDSKSNQNETSNTNRNRRRRGRKPRPASHSPSNKEGTPTYDSQEVKPNKFSEPTKSDGQSQRNKVAERRARRKAYQEQGSDSVAKEPTPQNEKSEKSKSEAGALAKKRARKSTRTKIKSETNSSKATGAKEDSKGGAKKTAIKRTKKVAVKKTVARKAVRKMVKKVAKK